MIYDEIIVLVDNVTTTSLPGTQKKRKGGDDAKEGGEKGGGNVSCIRYTPLHHVWKQATRAMLDPNHPRDPKS